MFKRLEMWHIVTAAFIGLSPACGGDEGAEKVEPIAARETGAVSDMPPSLAKGGSELASVQPVTQEKAPVETPVAPPPVKVEREPSQEEVLDSLAFAAERDPGDVRARVKLARALLDGGRRGEARRHAERAVEVDADSSAAWQILGRIELADRDLEAAVGAFSRAVEIEPDSSHAWNNLGYALIELRRFDEAAAALENATGGANPTAYMWNNLGMAYEHLDRIREARAAYRQAADAGSPKGQANLERLEGVISLVPATPAVVPQDGGQ